MTAFRHELRVLLRLSAPVALTQIGMMMTGVVDTAMVSRLGMTELAASALGNLWQWSLLSFGMGMVMGTDPLISQAHGRGDGPGTALALQRALLLAVLVSIPLTVGLLFTREGLVLFGQNLEVAELAARYNLFKLPTLVCFLVYTALRQYLQGRTLMAPASYVMWIGNGINAFLNWVLIYGRMGFPALGLEGAAIASSITTLFLVVGLVGWIWLFGMHRGAWRAWDSHSFSRQGLLQALRLGVPVGAQISLEVWAFSIATLMAGSIDTQTVSAHHIVLNLASLSFMVPLGVSQGAATRVGNLVGARDARGVRCAAQAALCLGAGVMLISATAFFFLRFWLPQVFTDDPALVLLAASILPIAAAFQLWDGTQVVAGGILRGLGRPDAAALANLLGYYVLALPLAYVFGVSGGLGLVGIWWGLAFGLFVVAVALSAYVFRAVRLPATAHALALRG